MKLTLIPVFILSSFTIVFGNDLQRLGFTMGDPSPAAIAAQKEAQKKEAAATALRYKNFIPSDPWRSVSNAPPVYAKGPRWVQFTGTVLSVYPDGIHVKGWYGVPEYWGPDDREFFVRNYPHKVADGDYISWKEKRCAALSEVYTYKGAFGERITLHSLDYGKPAPIPQVIRTVKPASTNLPVSQ